jgi:hypothetical protein
MKHAIKASAIHWSRVYLAWLCLLISVSAPSLVAQNDGKKDGCDCEGAIEVHSPGVDLNYEKHLLKGRLYDGKTGAPMPFVGLKIGNGGDWTMTEISGDFKLDLNVADKLIPGTRLTVYMHDFHLGHAQTQVIVPLDLDMGVNLFFSNDRFVTVSGIVMDKQTRASLSRMTVTVLPDVQGLSNLTAIVVETDASGWFSINIDRSKYGTVGFVYVTVQDKTGKRYREWIRLEQARNGLKIELERISD